MTYLIAGIAAIAIGSLFVALGLCRAAKIGDEGNALANLKREHRERFGG